MSSRLAQLMKLVEADPSDPLTHYALGLEHFELAQYAEALAAFDRTLAVDAGYIPAFHQKARAEMKLGRPDAARRTLEAGIRLADARGERHAADEMRKITETLG